MFTFLYNFYQFESELTFFFLPHIPLHGWIALFYLAPYFSNPTCHFPLFNFYFYSDFCHSFSYYIFTFCSSIIVFFQISRIEFIHGKNFIHRDMKPDNFLMGLGKKVCLSYYLASLASISAT